MVCTPYPSFSPIYEFKWYQWQITKIKLKDIIRLCASLWLACIHFILCLTWTCESYLREPIIVKLLKSEIWFDGRILVLSVYMIGKFIHMCLVVALSFIKLYFSKWEPSIALQLQCLSLPKPCVDLHDRNFIHMRLVVALSFIKFCDPSENTFHTCFIKITRVNREAVPGVRTTCFWALGLQKLGASKNCYANRLVKFQVLTDLSACNYIV